MRLIYMRPLIFQASASTRAKLAEKGMTPAKQMELERIRKVNLWLTLRNDKDMGAKEAAEVVGGPVANLYRWQKDPTVHSTRPKTLRESKQTPELVEAVTQLRLEQKTWGKEKIARRLQEEGFDNSIATVGYILT